MILYRTAVNLEAATLSGSFWTPSIEYAHLIHPKLPVFKATLGKYAAVFRGHDSPTKKLLKELAFEYDVAVFPAWDYDTDEYVILNPSVLRNVRRI